MRKVNSSTVTLEASNLSDKQRANLDFYSTDPRAINHLLVKMPELKYCEHILEPAAGNGILADRFTELTGKKVDMYDIISRREDIIEQDYLELNCEGKYDLIITNFPYSEKDKNHPIGFSELMVKALKDVAPGGYFCSFQRLLHLESQKRYERIYSKYKPYRIYIYAFRMNCFANGDMDQKISGAVAYSWAVWKKGIDGTFLEDMKIDWIYDK